jgi:CBS domain-containing protein
MLGPYPDETEGALMSPPANPPVRTGPTAIARFRVANAMHRGVLTCPRDTPLSRVASIMARERVHCVVVTDESASVRSLWGVVSDLDLVAAASVRNLDEQTAGGTAATAVLTISPRETLQRAAQLMTENATTHLIVVDPVDSHPVGVISTLDVASVLSEPASQ